MAILHCLMSLFSNSLFSADMRQHPLRTQTEKFHDRRIFVHKGNGISCPVPADSAQTDPPHSARRPPDGGRCEISDREILCGHTHLSHKNTGRAAVLLLQQKLHPNGKSGTADNCNRIHSGCAGIVSYTDGVGTVSAPAHQRVPGCRKPAHNTPDVSVLSSSQLHEAHSAPSFLYCSTQVFNLRYV